MPTDEFIKNLFGGRGTLAFLGALSMQAIIAIVWAVHQEARITAMEQATIRIERDVMAAFARSDRVDEGIHNLTNRIDRQETPLGRRVEQVEVRLLERIIVLESRVNELFIGRQR